MGGQARLPASRMFEAWITHAFSKSKILESLCDLNIKDISFRSHRKFHAGLRGGNFQVPGKVTAVSHFWNSTSVDPGQKHKLPRINDAINGSGRSDIAV